MVINARKEEQGKRVRDGIRVLYRVIKKDLSYKVIFGQSPDKVIE